MPIYHLTLRGPLHVGEAVSIDREAVLEWMPSDSLFSALVVAWAAGGHAAERLRAFEQSPLPFSLTSAFPWAASIRFFPAPVLLPPHSGLEGKRAKRVRWLSENTLEELCAGCAPGIEPRNFLHDGKVWVTTEEAEKIPKALRDETGQPRLWQTFTVPRVTVDRAASASNLFHAGRVTFAEGGGLWFAVRGPHADWVSDTLPALADAGLGGLRSYGHGAFDFEPAPSDLPDAAAGGPGFLLARYAPQGEDEIRAVLQKPGGAFYRLASVGGWCEDAAGQGWRRRTVRLVAEGAMFAEVAAARGQWVAVQPEGLPEFKDRKVYRYGWPFFIPAGHLLDKEAPA